MRGDERNLLEVLKAELEFLQKGGYQHTSPFSCWPPLIFEDSPTCLNFRAFGRQKPCSGCALMELVPPDRRTAKTPCRHIPLNSEGETVDNLYRWASAEEIETIVASWLKATIRKLESDRPEGQSPASATAPRAKSAAASGQR
jgi:hypothetical protein